MRHKLLLAYDGSDWAGWQKQRNATGIQQLLEDRLGQIAGQEIRVIGAGRTDAGVHALGQAAHFDLEWPHPPEALVQALQSRLPRSVHIRGVERVADAFHARFSSTAKRYVYRYYAGRADPFAGRVAWSLGHWQLDLAAMNTAAATLLGEHDFSAFGANPRDDRTESPVKRLTRLSLHRQGPYVTLVTEASGYLYKMVRSLAGCLADVGRGKLPPAALAEILSSRQRTARVVTAPPEGLFLAGVDYGTGFPAALGAEGLPGFLAAIEEAPASSDGPF